MFPHVPLQAITLDLADSHSVSLTVDRILSNSIYIPEGAVAAAASAGDQQGGGAGGGGGGGGGGDPDSETTPLPVLPGNNNNNSTTMDDESSATNTAQSTPRCRLSPEPHPQSHAPATPTKDSTLPSSLLHVQEMRSEDSDLKSHETSHGTPHDRNTEPSDSHDASTTRAQSTSDGEESHNLRVLTDVPTASSHDIPPELRRRKVDAEGIRAAKAISAGVAVGGESDSGGKEFLSTGKSFSQLFTSLQERKAELLRKARR